MSNIIPINIYQHKEHTLLEILENYKLEQIKGKGFIAKNHSFVAIMSYQLNNLNKQLEKLYNANYDYMNLIVDLRDNLVKYKLMKMYDPNKTDVSDMKSPLNLNDSISYLFSKLSNEFMLLDQKRDYSDLTNTIFEHIFNNKDNELHLYRAKVPEKRKSFYVFSNHSPNQNYRLINTKDIVIDFMK